MDAAVLIPTWNRLDYLRLCLKYYFQRTNYPHILVIADNGSTDGTKEWLKDIEKKKDEYLQKHNIEMQFWYFKKNYGLFRPQNLFMKTFKDRVEYLGLLHDDTIVCDNWIARFIRVLLSVPHAAIISPDDRHWQTPATENFGVKYLGESGTDSWGLFDFNDECQLMKSEAIEKVGYYKDNVYGQTDSKYYHNIRNLGYITAVDPTQIKEKVYDLSAGRESSQKYKKQCLLVKRIFCLYPRKLYEQVSGLLEWEHDGKRHTLEDEPKDWYEAPDAMLDRKNIPRAELDTGITKEDEEDFLKQWIK